MDNAKKYFFVAIFVLPLLAMLLYEIFGENKSIKFIIEKMRYFLSIFIFGYLLYLSIKLLFFLFLSE